MNQSTSQISARWYAVIDFFTATIAWICFYFIRQQLLKVTPGIAPESSHMFWLSLFLIPCGWLSLYSVTGAYNSLYKKSRLSELSNTFISCVVGCLILFLIFILNDTKWDYVYYSNAFIILLVIHFVFTFTGRAILLNKIKKQILGKTVQFNTLMIGNTDNATKVFRETEKRLYDGGYRYVGFITPDNSNKNGIDQFIPTLGTLDNLENIIDSNNIHVVVLAMERPEPDYFTYGHIPGYHVSLLSY